MSWLRLRFSVELGRPDPDPEMEVVEQSATDSLVERSYEQRPMGFYPSTDPTRRDPGDE